jgi:hypothetical protein
MAKGQPQPRPLNPQQKHFVDLYLGECRFNAEKAALQAGYAGDGWRVLKVPAVAAQVEERLEDAAMTADEVLARLSDQARNPASEFFRVDPNGRPYVDLQGLLDAGWGHVVKGIKMTEFGSVVEFFDAQAALIQIGRHHKLFTDRVEHDGSVEIEGVAEALDKKLEELAKRLEPAQ